MNSEFEYSEKIVAFVDILGFREKTNIACSNAKQPVHMMLQDIRNYIEICDDDSFLEQNCSTYSVFSDSSLYSAPLNRFENVVAAISQLQFFSATRGFFLRGGMTFGYIFDRNKFFYGKGLNSAYSLESSEAVYPRIIMDDNSKKDSGNSNFKEFKDKYKNTVQIKEDIDGKYFIDFLKPVDKDLINVKYEDLYSNENYEKISEAITKELKANIKKPSVLLKYIWLATYFNSSIEELGIECSEVKLDEVFLK